MTRVTAALEYAGRGWPVFPVEPRGKRPLTSHGVHDASTDTATITDWWKQWPDANLGLATGTASGLLVIDIDGPKGEAAYKDLCGTLSPPRSFLPFSISTPAPVMQSLTKLRESERSSIRWISGFLPDYKWLLLGRPPGLPPRARPNRGKSLLQSRLPLAVLELFRLSL